MILFFAEELDLFIKIKEMVILNNPELNELKLLSDMSLSLIIDVFIDAKITNIFVKDSYIRLFL